MEWSMVVSGYVLGFYLKAFPQNNNNNNFAVVKIQWPPLIVATSGPALSGHNIRWLLYPAVF